MVIPFSLINALITFQAYVHKALAGLLDIICVAYLNDILIFSRTEKEYWRYLHLVLRRFRNAELFAKLLKCFFFRSEVRFLGFIVGAYGIRMDPNYIKVILEWPTPRTFRDIQIFLGFINFYRRFVIKYLLIDHALISLLKGS